MFFNADDKNSIKQKFDAAIDDVKKLGGVVSLKSGEWLFPLIKNSFNNYYKNARASYFREKYPNLSDEAIIRKLISVSARNSMILGVITGAAISADEISAIIAATPTGGLNLPAQLGIAISALGAEAFLLIRFQLQLIAEIAKILEVPLNPDDPEDALLVLAFAIGGSGAEFAGKATAKAASHLTKVGVKTFISGTTLKALKRFAATLGQTILQRSILKYAVPGASMVVGGVWNYATTKTVGKVATKHFLASKQARKENNRSKSNARTKRKGAVQADGGGEEKSDSRWWEVLGVDTNSSQKEAKIAFEKLLTRIDARKSVKVSPRALKEREKKEKKIRSAYAEALQAIKKRS